MPAEVYQGDVTIEPWMRELAVSILSGYPEFTVLRERGFTDEEVTEAVAKKIATAYAAHLRNVEDAEQRQALWRKTKSPAAREQSGELRRLRAIIGSCNHIQALPRTYVDSVELIFDKGGLAAEAIEALRALKQSAIDELKSALARETR